MKNEVKVTDPRLLDEVVTCPEIRKMFPGMASQTVRMACRRGALVCRRSGRDWLVLRSSAEEYFNKPNKSGSPGWQRKD